MPESASVETWPRGRAKLIVMFATVLMGGLAGGALWCLLSLATDYDTTFLIVPLAIALAIFLRWQGYAGRSGVVCALMGTVLTFAYAQYLFAAVRIAQMLGFPLRSTLFKMDFALAWQVFRAHLKVWDIGLLVLACIVAAWLTARPVISRRVG